MRNGVGIGTCIGVETVNANCMFGLVDANWSCVIGMSCLLLDVLGLVVRKLRLSGGSMKISLCVVGVRYVDVETTRW